LIRREDNAIYVLLKPIEERFERQNNPFDCDVIGVGEGNMNVDVCLNVRRIFFGPGDGETNLRPKLLLDQDCFLISSLNHIANMISPNDFANPNVWILFRFSIWKSGGCR
jgi:hypothetical protein